MYYSLRHVIPMEYKQEEHVYAKVYAGEIYIAYSSSCWSAGQVFLKGAHSQGFIICIASLMHRKVQVARVILLWKINTKLVYLIILFVFISGMAWDELQGCELTSCTRLHRIRACLIVLDNSLVQLQNQERVFICCCAGYPVFAVVMLVCYCREPVSLPTWQVPSDSAGYVIFEGWTQDPFCSF